jgi:hypothetical protein
MNFYVYANGNPVNLVDPMGLSTGSYRDGLDDHDEMADGKSRAERNENGEWDSKPRGVIGELDIEKPKSKEKPNYKLPDWLNPKMWAKGWAAAIMNAQGFTNPFAEPEPKNYVEKKNSQPTAPPALEAENNKGVLGNILDGIIEGFKGGWRGVSEVFGERNNIANDAKKGVAGMKNGIVEVAINGPPEAKGLMAFAGVATLGPGLVMGGAYLGPVARTTALMNPAYQEPAYDFIEGFSIPDAPPTNVFQWGGAATRNTLNTLFD